MIMGKSMAWILGAAAFVLLVLFVLAKRKAISDERAQRALKGRRTSATRASQAKVRSGPGYTEHQLEDDPRVSKWVGWNFHGRVEVVGIQFRREDALKAFTRTPEGSEVELVRDPNNDHDPNAIEVWFGNHHVGYMPKGTAKEAAKRFPLDMPIRARYVDGWMGDTGYIRLTIQPLMPDAKSRKEHGWSIPGREG